MAVDTEVKRRIQDGYSAYLRGRGFRPRHGQKEMIAGIARTLLGGPERLDGEGQGPVGVIEAGTGTGKTLAYLLAALPIAEMAEKQVVIATATVALQEQILYKDFPELVTHTGWHCTIALAKGRGRYLCPLRLEMIMDAVGAQESGLKLFDDEIPFVPGRAEQRLYRRLGNAFEADEWNGDRDRWPDALSEQEWRPLTAERSQCSGPRCRRFRDCPFFKDRDALLDAECIVANHDLLLADLALGGGVILPPPEDTLYIIDEGHRLGDTALRHFSGSCRVRAAVTWLDQARRRLEAVQQLLAPIDGVTATLRPLLNRLASMEDGLKQLEPGLQTLLHDSKVEVGRGGLRYRFPLGDVGRDLRAISMDLARQSEALVSSLDSLGQHLATALDSVDSKVPQVDIEQYHQQVGGWRSRAAALMELWQMYSVEAPTGGETPPIARWLEAVDSLGQADVQLCASPVSAGSVLATQLWRRCGGAVITSATLRSLGSFQRLERAQGLPRGTHYAVVESAFDHESAGELRIPRDAVDGGLGEEHTQAIIALLPTLLAKERGTLVLFASRHQMEAVYEGMAEELREQILMQGRFSNQEIIQRHRQTIDEQRSSTIFGLASFSEGVDLPGEYCSHVIITKLPFAVPDDPVQATMAEWIENRGGNPFMEIALPDASFRLVQACGRLLRSEQDRGRITLLDRRVLTRRYGSRLLADLPPFRRVLS